LDPKRDRRIRNGGLCSLLGFADSIPVTPEQISLTPQPILPAFQEVGKAGAMPVVLTMKNISKTHMIGVKASNPISAVIVSQLEIGHVDRSDTLVPPSAFSSTTCIKPNGLPVLLAPGGTCLSHISSLRWPDLHVPIRMRNPVIPGRPQSSSPLTRA